MGVTVTVDRRELERALSLLRSVVMRETPLDLYRHVLVERSAEPDAPLVLRATNINSFGQVVVPVEGEPGRIALALPPVSLGAVAGNIRSDRLKLYVERLAVTITGGGSRTLLRGPDPSDFASLPEVRPMKTFTVPAWGLAGAIRGVSYATIKRDEAASQSHKVTGFEIDVSEDNPEETRLCLVATDSLRMAEELLPVADLTEDPTRQPGHTPGMDLATPEERRRTQYVYTTELLLLLPALEATAGEERVTVSADWRLLSVKSERWEFVVSVAEQKRLKVRESAAGLVAGGAAGGAAVERLALAAAIRAARAIVPVKGDNPDPVVHDDGVAVMFIPGEDGQEHGTLVIRTGDRDGQSYYEELPAKVEAPEPLFRVIAMKFLLDALGQFETSEVRLSFGPTDRSPVWMEANPVPKESGGPEANPREAFAMIAPRNIDENSTARTLRAEWEAFRAERVGAAEGQGELALV